MTAKGSPEVSAGCRDFVERGAQLVADVADHADNHQRDQRGDQAIFDCRRARFVDNKSFWHWRTSSYNVSVSAGSRGLRRSSAAWRGGHSLPPCGARRSTSKMRI